MTGNCVLKTPAAIDRVNHVVTRILLTSLKLLYQIIKARSQLAAMHTDTAGGWCIQRHVDGSPERVLSDSHTMVAYIHVEGDRLLLNDASSLACRLNKSLPFCFGFVSAEAVSASGLPPAGEVGCHVVALPECWPGL